MIYMYIYKYTYIKYNINASNTSRFSRLTVFVPRANSYILAYSRAEQTHFRIHACTLILVRLYTNYLECNFPTPNECQCSRPYHERASDVSLFQEDDAMRSQACIYYVELKSSEEKKYLRRSTNAGEQSFRRKIVYNLVRCTYIEERVELNATSRTSERFTRESLEWHTDDHRFYRYSFRHARICDITVVASRSSLYVSPCKCVTRLFDPCVRDDRSRGELSIVIRTHKHAYTMRRKAQFVSTKFPFSVLGDAHHF